MITSFHVLLHLVNYLQSIDFSHPYPEDKPMVYLFTDIKNKIGTVKYTMLRNNGNALVVIVANPYTIMARTMIAN